MPPSLNVKEQRFFRLGNLQRQGFERAIPGHLDGEIDIHFGIVPRMESGHGGNDNTACFDRIWADYDNLDEPPSWPVEPSVEWETSPGKRQATWLLSRPITREETVGFNRRMAQATRSDPAATNAERVLRLPGFINTKYAERPRCRVISNTEKRYDPEELDAVLPPPEDADIRTSASRTGTFHPNKGARSEQMRDQSQRAAPSDFALRYGKSPYPRSLCGLATKVFSRSDGKVKHLLSLRDWKWDCPKCAPLLKRYWLEKLGRVSFRFILKLPTMAKPTAFLRRLGKPDYTHIVANGESWLFLTDGHADNVWRQARKAGYDLVTGDISGDPAPYEIRDCLEQALCAEEEPLNTRRKVTHSRGLIRKLSENTADNESKQKDNCALGDSGVNAEPVKERPSWDTEVVMKPIEEMANELEAEGWHILWKSEVEAIAIKDESLEATDLDIVDLLENLGVKLKKVGKEYMGLCPFHLEKIPSLSVNREKGLWHCFGCDRGGGAARFIEEWQKRNSRAGADAT